MGQAGRLLYTPFTHWYHHTQDSVSNQVQAAKDAVSKDSLNASSKEEAESIAFGRL